MNIQQEESNDTQTFQYTDKGKRASNADAILLKNNLLMIADGIGNKSSSAKASEMALDLTQQYYFAQYDLSSAIQQAHLTLKEYNQRPTQSPSMGTTIVAAALQQDSLTVAWVGDSRAYLIDPEANHITQLTEDHSFVNELVNKGEISKEQAQHHPRRNVITRCLGLTKSSNIAVDKRQANWHKGLLLLLCSDGISGYLDNDTILACLRPAHNLKTQGNALVEAALNAGSSDNISLILVKAV